MFTFRPIVILLVVAATFSHPSIGLTAENIKLSSCLNTPTKTCLLQNSLKLSKAVASPTERATLLGAIAAEQIRLGDPTSARQTFKNAIKASESVKILNERISVLRYIAGCQSKAKNIAEAQETLSYAVNLAREAMPFEKNKKPKIWLSILHPLAREQIKLGDKKGAASTLREILAIISKLENSYYKSVEIMLTASDQARADSHDTAKQTFLRARNIAEALKSAEQRTASLLSIAEKQANSGFKIAARETLFAAINASNDLSSKESQAKFNASITLHLLMLEGE